MREIPESSKPSFWEKFKNRHFNRDEFVKILEKSSEWSLISPEEKDAIMVSLNDNAVKKILQITIAVNLFDLTVNLTAGGMSLPELTSGDISFDSPAVIAYLAKWVLAPVIAYLFWKKDQVNQKALKAASLSIPAIGAVTFPALTLKDHTEFLNFWRIYNKTKKAFRSFMHEEDESKKVEKENSFKTLLEKKLNKQKGSNDYRKRMLNIVNAQGYNLEEVKVVEDEEA